MTGAWGSCISHGPLAAVVSLHSPRLPKSEHSSEKHPYRAWRWNTLFSRTKRNIIFPHRGIIVSRVILMSTLISIILRLLQGIKETRRSCVFNPIFSRLDYKLIIFSPREKKKRYPIRAGRDAHTSARRATAYLKPVRDIANDRRLWFYESEPSTPSRCYTFLILTVRPVSRRFAIGALRRGAARGAPRDAHNIVDLYVARCNELQTSAWFSDPVSRNAAGASGPARLERWSVARRYRCTQCNLFEQKHTVGRGHRRSGH